MAQIDANPNSLLFLVDVGELAASREGMDRRSVINSHVARMQHMARRQAQIKRLRRVNTVSELQWTNRKRVPSFPTRPSNFAAISISEQNGTLSSNTRYPDRDQNPPTHPNSDVGCVEEFISLGEFMSIRQKNLMIRSKSNENNTNFLKREEWSESWKSMPNARPPPSQTSRLVSILGVGQYDPFNALPFNPTKDDHRLFHFYHNVVAQVVYGYGPKAPLCYLQLITRFFINDVAAMRLVLSFSSYAWSSLFGKNREWEKRGLAHKVDGITVINQRLGEPKHSITDSSIQAVIIMSAIEGRAGNVEAFRAHLEGARTMVKLRGGLDKLSRLLIWQICSAELRLIDSVGVDMFPCIDRHFGTFLVRDRPDVAVRHTAFDQNPTSPRKVMDEVLNFFEPRSIPPRLYLSACVSEFIMIINQFYVLSESRNEIPLDWNCLEPQNHLQRPRFASARCRSISNSFQPPNSSLYWILSPTRTLPQSHTINQNTTAALLYKQDYTRAACLFYIHATLWRYRNEPEKTDEYMKLLVWEVQRNGLGESKSVDAMSWVLMWLCLCDTYLEQDKNERGWKELTRLIPRLTRVVRKLSNNTRLKLESALFEALVGRTACTGTTIGTNHQFQEIDEDRRWADPQVVWNEVMAEEGGYVPALSEG